VSEGWGWQVGVLLVAALLVIALLGLIFRRIGVIADGSPNEMVGLTAYDQVR
jgi:hypothetical protein